MPVVVSIAFCPACGSSRNVRLRGEGYRCAACRVWFRAWLGRFIRARKRQGRKVQR